MAVNISKKKIENVICKFVLGKELRLIFFNNIGQKVWGFTYWKEQEKNHWMLKIGCYFYWFDNS